MTEQQLENFDVKSIPDDADTGYIPKVDFEYPAAIHDIHSDLPVAPVSSSSSWGLVSLQAASSRNSTHQTCCTFEAHPKSTWQREVRGPLLESQAVLGSWPLPEENPPRSRVYLIFLAANLHLYEHWERKSRPQRFWKWLLRINEKLDIWQDTGDCQRLQ